MFPRNLFGGCAVFLAASLPAFAGSFYGSGVSARSIGFGGMYVPTETGVVDSLASNPAGLTLLGSPTVDLNLIGAFAGGEFSNSANRGVKMETTRGVLPFGGFGTPLGKSRFSVGVGVLPEMMSASNWRYVDAKGAAGASWGLADHRSEIGALRTSAGVGFYAGPWLSLGATVGAVYNTNTLQGPYIFQSHPVLRGLKTRLDLQTSGTGWNASFGALVRPSRKLNLGVAYKTRTVIRSTGDAEGTLDRQFEALGLAAPPEYRYEAEVKNVLPQSVLASAAWQATPRWKLALQADWVNWSNAFRELPVQLTSGTNAAVNGLLGSNGIFDQVPLHWKDQVTVRAGVERLITESASLRGAYAYSNSAVPGSTLAPLTAAIMKNTVSTGLGYKLGRYRFDLGYSVDLPAEARVGRSALAGGEYSNSRLRVMTQTLAASTAIRF